YYIKIYIAEKGTSVNGFAQFLYIQDLVARLSFRFKNNSGILSVTWRNVFKHQLIQCFFTGGCLLALTRIGTESCNKFQKILLLFFLLFILISGLSCSKLAAFVPESIVTGVNFDLLFIHVSHV